MFIYADQIQALPAAICRALIRFLCVQVNLLRAAPLVHSRKKILWERACSRMRSVSQQVSCLTLRIREQARSHTFDRDQN